MLFIYFIKTENEQVIDAGCRAPKWKDEEDEKFEEYYWQADGYLLAEGACLMKASKKYLHLPPEPGKTKVGISLKEQQIRHIDSRKQTFSFDTKLTMRWWDHRIRSDRISEELKHEISLSPAAVQKIWTPDLIIHDQTSFKFEQEWISLISAKIFASNDSIAIEKQISFPANVEITYQIKSSVYCKFNHSRYPMGSQKCDVRLGSSSFGAIFVLETNATDDKNLKYSTSTFDVETEFFDDGQHDSGSNTIGIEYALTHSIKPFIFKYYLPCMAIVTVSMIGFAIPLTAIPGRVALLVTQFLTLTNLFIYQMVIEMKKLFHSNYVIKFYEVLYYKVSILTILLLLISHSLKVQQ